MTQILKAMISTSFLFFSFFFFKKKLMAEGRWKAQPTNVIAKFEFTRGWFLVSLSRPNLKRRNWHLAILDPAPNLSDIYATGAYQLHYKNKLCLAIKFTDRPFSVTIWQRNNQFGCMQSNSIFMYAISNESITEL